MPSHPQFLNVVLVCTFALWGVQSAPSQSVRDLARPAYEIELYGVEGRLDHLAVDAKRKRLFIAALEHHSIEIVDLARHRRLRSLTGINEPQGLLFDSESDRLFVCSRGDGTCRSFAGDRFTEGPWIDFGRNADNIRLHPASRQLLVGFGGEPGAGGIAWLPVQSLIPLKAGGKLSEPRSPADFLLDHDRQADPAPEFSFPSHPESFQIDPVSHQIYVNLPDEHQIRVLRMDQDGLKDLATWPVTVGERNFPMAIAPGLGLLLIATRQPANLAGYNLKTGKLEFSCPCVGDADDLYFDAHANRVYLTGGEGYWDTFELQSGTIPRRVAHVPTWPKARTGLFLANSHEFAVAVPHSNNRSAAILIFKTAN